MKILLRSGFTLVELLVALTIAAVLTVVALPKVREGLQQNAAGRSATLVKSAFETARGNAIRTSRPYGVTLHRLKNVVTPDDPDDGLDDPLLSALHGANFCKQMSFAQVAFDYRGDQEGAVMTYDDTTAATPAGPFFTASVATSGLLSAIAAQEIDTDNRPIDVGSVIRFGENGTPGVITNLVPFPTTSPTVTRVYVAPAFPVLPGQTLFQPGEAVTYSIETRPIPSPLAAVDLPGKIVIDLASSGLSTSTFMLSPRSIYNTATLPPLLRVDPAVPTPLNVYGYRDVTIMFNASGQLDSVYIDQQITGNQYLYSKVAPVGPLSLLIGEIDGVVLPETIARYPGNRGALTTWPDPPYPDPTIYDRTERKRPNFANSDASWLSISPSSGKTVLSTVSAPFGVANEAIAHPELGASHGVDILIRDRLLDSRRLTRGSAL